jgi:hypothetical protein
MIALSTKLTLLVLLLPISIVAILDLVTYYIYGTLIIEASNILSSVLVFLLVWERLRESLSKKLEYLDDNVFLDLFSKLQNYPTYLLWSQDDIRRATDDLKRHGRFMIIALYSSELLNNLDDFLSLHEAFYSKFQQLLDLGQKKLGASVDRWKLLHYLDFDMWCSQSSPEEEKAYMETAKGIEEDQHNLVSETKTLFEKTKNRRTEASKELEEFLKCNNLRTKPEPVKVVSPFG